MKNLIGYHYVAPTNKFIRIAGQKLCQNDSPLQLLCTNIFFLTTGFSDQLNTVCIEKLPRELICTFLGLVLIQIFIIFNSHKTLAMAYLGHLPAGASTNQVTYFWFILL